MRFYASVCVFGHQSQKKNKNERRKTFFLFRHSSVPFVTFMLFGIIMEAHSTRPHFHNSISKCGKQIHAHTHAHVTPCPQIHIRTQTHKHTGTQAHTRREWGKKESKTKIYVILLLSRFPFDTRREEISEATKHNFLTKNLNNFVKGA